MNEIVLRPYQKQFIDDVRNEFKHNQRRVVGVAPCGAGKTIMTGWIIKQTMLNGGRAIFFVHRKELIEQTSATFTALDIPHGIIASGVRPNPNFLVQIASVQTLLNRLPLLNAPNLLVCDECHHILANSYKDIINTWNDAFLLGVTATPERMGGITLNDVFSSMVQAPTVAELIQLGNLTHFEYFTMDIEIVTRELEQIDIIRGDYRQAPLSVLMNNPEVIDAIVDGYKEYSQGKSAICYCVNVKHSQNVADALNDAGIPTAHCDGNTPKKVRAQIIEDFRQGKYKILCNAELFGEGFDVPNCHAVILARPTKSLTLHIQQSMRSMRPDPSDPNKTAIIIDCVKNCDRHGYPDTPRIWTLDPNVKKKKASKDASLDNQLINDYHCPQCDNPVNDRALECPHCGYKFYADEHALTNINHEYSSRADSIPAAPNSNAIIRAPSAVEYFAQVAARKNYKQGWIMYRALEVAKSFNDLEEIRKFMNYKSGWSYFKAQELGIPIPSSKA